MPPRGRGRGRRGDGRRRGGVVSTATAAVSSDDIDEDVDFDEAGEEAEAAADAAAADAADQSEDEEAGDGDGDGDGDGPFYDPAQYTDEDIMAAARDLPGLMSIFDCVRGAASLGRPLSDVAVYAKACLDKWPVAQREGAFNKKGNVHYTSRPLLVEIQQAIADEVRRASCVTYGQQDFFAASGDLLKPTHMLKSLLSVALYRVTADFERAVDFCDVIVVEDSKAAALVDKMVLGMERGAGLSKAAIRAGGICFLSDGGSNFAGVRNGAVQRYQDCYAPNSVPARCFAHIIERIMKVVFDEVMVGGPMKHHPLYYLWRALGGLAQKQGLMPHMPRIDARVNVLSVRGATIPSVIPIAGDTRWSYAGRSAEAAVKLIPVLAAHVPDKSVPGNYVRHLEMLLGLAALLPLSRALTRLVNAAQHHRCDLVSLRARARLVLARLREIYAADFANGDEFDVWRAMMDVGDSEVGEGGGWFARHEVVAGEATPRRVLGQLSSWERVDACNVAPVGTIILVLVCDRGVFKPVYSTWDARHGGAGGALRNQDYVEAQYFGVLRDRVQTRMRASIIGASWAPPTGSTRRELGQMQEGGILRALEDGLNADMLGFNGEFETVLKGVDFVSYIPDAQGGQAGAAPSPDEVVAAAIGLKPFSGQLDEDALRDQAGDFALEAAAAATHLRPRSASDRIGEDEGDGQSRWRTFWITMAASGGAEISEWVKLAKIVACLPVSSAENERHFSKVKLHMPRLRTKLSVANLRNALAVTYARSVNVARALHQWLNIKRRNRWF